MESKEQILEERLIDLQADLRNFLYCRPFDIQGAENAAHKLCDKVVDTIQQTATLQAENKRLRGALERIVEMKPFLSGLAANMREIAQEALNNTATEALKGKG